MNKQSFLDKIIARLKGGDEAKLSRFADKLVKFYNNQIKMRKESIEKLREKQEDLEDQIKDAIEAVDVDAINKTEGADSYCQTYHNRIDKLIAQSEQYDDEIDTLELEIERLEKISSKVLS